MAKLIDELKNRYQDRYLIIESPPPMLAPRTIAIAKQVDAIIVVIKFGSTSMDADEELIDNLGKEKSSAPSSTASMPEPPDTTAQEIRQYYRSKR